MPRTLKSSTVSLRQPFRAPRTYVSPILGAQTNSLTETAHLNTHNIQVFTHSGCSKEPSPQEGVTIIISAEMKTGCFASRVLDYVDYLWLWQILVKVKKKKAMIRKRYNQVPHLTRDTIWESDQNTRNHHTQESQEVSPFPAGDHKAAWNRQDSITKKNTNHQKQKRSIKEAPPKSLGCRGPTCLLMSAFGQKPKMLTSCLTKAFKALARLEETMSRVLIFGKYR